jgi:hypothetical protein
MIDQGRKTSISLDLALFSYFDEHVIFTMEMLHLLKPSNERESMSVLLFLRVVLVVARLNVFF